MSEIFSGSKKHMLLDIFSQASRPFFNSTEMMFLDAIPREEYFSFIRSHFSRKGKFIGNDALEKMNPFQWIRLKSYCCIP